MVAVLLYIADPLYITSDNYAPEIASSSTILVAISLYLAGFIV
jgi:hypothetical protein